MRYRIILTSKMAEQLKTHLLSDRSREQMAITLCGINRLKDETRLLGRHLILLPPEAFLQQTAAYLEVSPDVQHQILSLAASEGLSQIDWHSHPGESPFVNFSGIDDLHERELANYIQKRIAGTLYGSVVMNRIAVAARIWQVDSPRIEPNPIDAIRWGEFKDEKPSSLRQEGVMRTEAVVEDHFSRQVLAFGKALQEKLKRCRIGVIGVGGLGGIVVEMLARLGAADWVLVDDDIVEVTNLNRLPGSSQKDVYHRLLKVSLAQRNIFRVNPYARIRTLPLGVSAQKVLQALKSCDILIAATDNHSSRLIANRLSVQYLIPLIHLGVNIDVDDARRITDMSGEYVFPNLGQWCLQCAGIIDSQMAGWELADEELRTTLRNRGYIKDTPAPAVYHLNGVVASLAVAEIHNFIVSYKPIQRYLTYDELKGELVSLDVASGDNCPVCSAEGGYLGLGDLEPLPDYERKARTVPSPDQFEGEHLDPGASSDAPLDDLDAPLRLPEEA
jgi:molybdopterin-synthase adenylyltransferase